MKKLLVIAASALLATSAFAYKDGSYVGEGQGNGSQIKVEVTVQGGKVTAVKTVSHGETDMIFSAAEGTILPAVVEKNGTNGVEAVSGATNSSNGLIEAVNKALEQAK